jgi:Cu/Zn superoxide dismutase
MKKFLPTLIFLSILAYLPLSANHLSASLLFTARLNGAQEVPEVTTDAQGVAMFSLDQRHNTIFINAQFSNLSGPITGAHIHEGAPGENGGVVIDLSSFLIGNRLKGAVRDIDADAVAKMLNGDYYINVHTAANPGGEIRGQISLETDTRYSAIINGNNEVPATTSNGAGVAVFHLSHDRSAGINFKILFQGLSSDVTGAHIHQAAAGMNGGVVLDLQPYMQGNRIEGTWEPAPALLDALLAGELYINIHTVNNPGGEIRGQLELLPGFTFDATLTGSQEVPAVTSPADGLGIVTVDPSTNQVNYYIVYDSIVGAITGAHFHEGVTGSNGGVVINLQDGINGNVISGSADIDLNLFNAMLRAGLYINIHSAAHPGGEIRGQVLKFAREGFTFEMNGGQEVPPVTSPATGAGMVSIGRDQANLHYMIVYSGLTNTFTGAHFHSGAPGTNGNVIYDLTNEFNAFGGAYGYWDADSDPPFTYSPIFLSNDVYVNIHTDANPGGEIRGNIIRSRDIFTEIPFDPEFGDNLTLSALLLGEEEVPPVTTSAVGLATLYLDEDKNNGVLNLAVNGLSGQITGAHIHEGDAGTNGGVLFPIATQGNRAHQDITIPDLDLISILNGATYVNVHTAANPGGEIRGQLILEQDVALVGFLNGENEEPDVTTDAVGLVVVNYTQGQLAMDIKVQWTGMSSPVTGAHFHTGQPGVNGPVMIDLSDFITGNRIETRIELTIEELTQFALNNVYINVHTETNPGGEIRAQLNFLPGITFDGWMSPLQEVPFTTSEASGLVVGTHYPGPNDIALWMVVDNASGPLGAAHLHNAPMLENGGVVHDLSESIVGNSIQHLGILDEGLLGEMLSGDLYINVHTAAFPGGELRGQLIRNARDGYGFDLCPEQEVGTVNAPGATGNALVSIDRLHKNVNITVVADGLTGPITSSHIHSAPIGVNGGVIADLTDFYVGNAMAIAGAEADTGIINAILSGDTYINVHTAAHPGGEIRGQIVKDLLCELMVGVDPIADLINEVTLSPVPVVDQLKVGLNIVQAGRYELSVVDLTGRLISNESYDFSIGGQEVLIPAADLLPGFYSLVISNGSAAQAFKFVK